MSEPLPNDQLPRVVKLPPSSLRLADLRRVGARATCLGLGLALTWSGLTGFGGVLAFVELMAWGLVISAFVVGPFTWIEQDHCRRLQDFAGEFPLSGKARARGFFGTAATTAFATLQATFALQVTGGTSRADALQSVVGIFTSPIGVLLLAFASFYAAASALAASERSLDRLTELGCLFSLLTSPLCLILRCAAWAGDRVDGFLAARLGGGAAER